MRFFRYFFALQRLLRFSFGKYPLQAVECSSEVPLPDWKRHPMEPDRRIRELEAQVEHLTGLVTELMAGRDRDAASAEAEAAEDEARVSTHEREGMRSAGPVLVEQMRRGVDHVLAGESPELLEARIGAVWLSRLAALALMTALALAARTTFQTDAIGPLQKVGIGYALAILFSAYGLFHRKREDFFAEAVLGCGLAGFYFTTYAVFFIDQMKLDVAFLRTPWLGVGLVTCSLAALVLVAHWRRSQTVAGLGLFLAYYTVVVSCTRAPALENVLHALLTCGVLAVATFLFHYAHRWILFSWGALIASHLTYIFFFFRKPAGLTISDAEYFWLSNGFLTLSYVLFSLTCVVDARKTGEYRRTVAPMSGVNSAVFLVLSYVAVRGQYPEQQWMFRAGVGTLLLFFSVLAETTGPKRNYLFQIYMAKTVIMYTLALQAYWSERGEIFLLAMSIECLGLAFSYRRSGIVAFKVLELGLMVVTFLGALLSVKMAGEVRAFGYSMPANWFCAGGVALMFQVVAWYYERHVRPLRPSQRTTSGQWFLADTALDLRGPTMAIIHAAVGVLLLLAITIMELEEDPALPFLLAGEAAILGGLGLVLRTPQIELASVLLGAAGHLCYYVFLWREVPGFEQQPDFVALTVFLAGFTYVGAYAWESYLRRFRHPEAVWEHYGVAAVPYLAATLLLTILLARQLPPVMQPAAQAALGAGLLLAGAVARYPGIKASGLLAAGMASAVFFRSVYDASAPVTKDADFVPYFMLYLGMLVLSERFFAWLQRIQAPPSHLENGLRTLLTAVLVWMGALGLSHWASDNEFLLYLLLLAVALFACGFIFREGRYRWGALFLFGVVMVRTYLYFWQLSPLHQIATFGATAAVLLAVSWGYSVVLRRRRRAAKPRTAEKEAPKDGTANS